MAGRSCGRGPIPRWPTRCRTLRRTVHSGLAIAFVSVTPTARRRHFWAVWWSGEPQRRPLTKPDASGGGARSLDEALREAERASGRPLKEIDPVWARAWKRTLRGEPAFTPMEEARLDGKPPPPRKTDGASNALSIWAILDVAEGATPTEIKRAYRAKALLTHPDRGGDPDAFRAVQRAFEEALARQRPRRRAPSAEPTASATPSASRAKPR